MLTANGGLYYAQHVAGVPPSALVMKREREGERCKRQ
eukprot:COSAG06_NODE_46093_length_349_cov_1.204000_2_plen_36_part_01